MYAIVCYIKSSESEHCVKYYDYSDDVGIVVARNQLLVISTFEKEEYPEHGLLLVLPLQ